MPDNWKWDDEDKSAADFDKAIKSAKDSGAKKLNLRINSPGGYVHEAVAMRSILARAGFDEINIHIEGLCASAATIPATLPGAHVTIAPGSEYMIHNPWTWASGNADDLEKTVRNLRQCEDTSVAFYAKKTSQGEDQIRQWMKDETWFTAEEAVKYGFCDAMDDEGGDEAIVACVSSGMMNAMRGLYAKVPTNLSVKAEEKAAHNVSTEPLTVAAGGEAENKNCEEKKDMDIKELTLEQLRAENPSLVNEIMQNAANAERERMQDIDDLTPAGYEAMAAEAKANGTSAMDYHKQIIKAQREKADKYLADRKNETQQSEKVVAAAAEDKAMTNEDDELKQFASEAAAIAKGANGYAESMY